MTGCSGWTSPRSSRCCATGVWRMGPLEVPADQNLAVDGAAVDSLELQGEMESAAASRFGIKVCASPDGQEETSVFYDAEGEAAEGRHAQVRPRRHPQGR